MVHIYKNKRGNKNYYYLRKSVRKGKKVTSENICYLGTDLLKLNLEEIKKKHQNEINDFNSIKRTLELNLYLEKSKKKNIKEDKYFTKEQLVEINAVLTNFQKVFKKKNLQAKKEIIEKLKILFIIESTALERILLTKKEKIRLLKENIPPKNKPLREIYNIINTKKILNFLEEKKFVLNLSALEKIQDIFMEGMERRSGLRNHKIKIPGSSFSPIEIKDIKSELKRLFLWYNKNQTKIHPLALTVLFHHKFEKIHPFSYGNGEIGRILINNILSKSNYPNIIISASKKEKYFEVLNVADKAVKKDILNTNMKYYKPLIDFMQKQFVKTYWDNFVI